MLSLIALHALDRVARARLTKANTVSAQLNNKVYAMIAKM